MKIEPRKIKKTLKYGAIGVCVATTLIATGCDEHVQLGGSIVAPTPTESSCNETAEPTEQNVPLEEEKTPEIAGGIPTPETEVELSGDIAYK